MFINIGLERKISATITPTKKVMIQRNHKEGFNVLMYSPAIAKKMNSSVKAIVEIFWNNNALAIFVENI